jgi:autotransporter-associated beta strand protein
MAGATTWSFNGAVSSTWSVPGNWIATPPMPGQAPPQDLPAGDTTDIVIGGNLNGAPSLTQDRDHDVLSSITINPYSNTSIGTLSISALDNGTLGPATTHEIDLGAGGLTDTSTATVAFQTSASALGTFSSLRTLVLTADQTWNVNKTNATILSMRRQISGNFKVTKIGPSTLEFQGDNTTWTGGMDFQEGTLRLSGLTLNGVLTNKNPLGLGTLTINTANNVAFSSSGSGDASNNDQVFNEWIDLGGTGSINFSGSRPYEFNGTVNFLTNKVLTVNSGQPLTVNGLLTGSGALIKRGAGTMTIVGSSTFTGGVSVENGTLTIPTFAVLGTGASSINLGTGGTSGGTVHITGDTTTSRPISVKGPTGTIDSEFNVTVNNTISGTGALTKSGGGTLVVNAIQTGTLSISGTVRINPNGTAAGLSIVPALNNGGTLDLQNNSLIVDYDPVASPNTLQQIHDGVVSGYHGGDWKGSGITSGAAAAKVGSQHATAIGYGEASTLGITSFKGQTLDSSAVIATYTLVGDANLDGVVNALDFNAVASNFGAASPVWTQGDFNYDNSVTATDFTAMAQNFGLTIAGAGAASLGSVVPEPGCLLLASGLILLARRGRKRHSDVTSQR